MTRIVSTAAVRAALIEGREIALLDVREEGPYSRGHPLFAVSLPLSRLELKVLDLVPRFDAPIAASEPTMPKLPQTPSAAVAGASKSGTPGVRVPAHSR